VSLELVSVDELVRESLDVVASDAAAAGVELIDLCAATRPVAPILCTSSSHWSISCRTPSSTTTPEVVTLTSEEVADRLRLRVTDTVPAWHPSCTNDSSRPSITGCRVQGIEVPGWVCALQRLMEAIGGSLGVESAPGVGSTFWLELPLATTSTNFATTDRS